MQKGEDSALSVEVIKKLLKENATEINTEINTNLNNKFSKLNELIIAHEKNVVKLQSEVSYLRNTVDKISSENDYLWSEINKLNLVINGVSESENETNDQLRDKISELLKQLMGKDCNFDTVHRLGKIINGKQRMVKIRFFSLYLRDEVFKNRFNNKHPIYINEDLPSGIRRDHAVMRKKRKILIAEGHVAKQIRMDWKKKTVHTADSVFKVKDGAIIIDQYDINFTSRDKENVSTHSSNQNEEIPTGRRINNNSNTSNNELENSITNYTHPNKYGNGGVKQSNGLKQNQSQSSKSTSSAQISRGRRRGYNPSPLPPKSPSLLSYPSTTSSTRPPVF
ncbi:hypothetical protein Fcan01_26847 [Folsomia candida]|uniref:Uncharacterized protein n=1 Tax=Folsomia candida TaxID=158441 RepID=A0A226CZT8_FOLCA|nr:hypothetical protein Fcan01_26847 [Folsomia candida]